MKEKLILIGSVLTVASILGVVFTSGANAIDSNKEISITTSNTTIDLNRIDPPAETAQIPKGDMTDPEHLRTLAAWYQDHPEVRDFFQKRDNPNNLPMDYYEDGRPVPPGYMGEIGGDYSNPAYLSALADYYEKNPLHYSKVSDSSNLSISSSYNPNFIPFPEMKVNKITVHEQSTTLGKKTIEIEFLTKSMGQDYPIVEGRDGFVSIVGTTEKQYNVTGSKSKVTLIKKDDHNSEYKLVQYVEVDAAEKGILSGNFSHDGRLWLVETYNIKPTIAP